MVGNKVGTVIGKPLIEGAKIRAEVEEITKDRKVIAFKMRRRKNSRRIRGFRKDLTIIRIKEIIIPDELFKTISEP